MSTPDELRDRLQAGDTSALSDYLLAYRPQLLAFIERRLGESLRRRVEAEDIFQEMAKSAWEYLPRTDLSDRDPFGWCCQLAEQRLIDAARKAQAGKRDAGREVGLNTPAGDTSNEWVSILAASITSPSHAATRAERNAQLQSAITELPEDVRQILRWRYVENLPTKEIAAKTGRTDGAIRVLLTRTIHKLQALMSE